MKILDLLTPRRLLGNRGEREAVKYLKKRGYLILERGYVTGNSEIDVIAELEDTLVFVEVKTRSAESHSPKEPRPASSVNKKKQQKIINAAMRYKKDDKMKMRFDIIEVIAAKNKKGKETYDITHIISAFDGNTAAIYH